jgi:WD40 repeat protein
MKRSLLFCICLITAISSYSFENDLASICLRPGTDEIFVGGEFETVFVIDKKDGRELRRLTVENGALDMQFSPDGKHLIVVDENKVHLLNPETGEETYFVKASNARLFENSPYFIDADWIYTKSIIVYSTTDGSQVFKYTPTFKPLDAGFDAEFKELIILGRSMEIKGEKKLIQNEVKKPEKYNVYRKAYFEKQANKKGAGFEVINMDTKTSVLKVELPYETAKSFGLSISKYKDDYYISCWDMLLRIDNQGRAFPIECSEATYAYTTNAVSKAKQILVASTKQGYLYNCESNQFVSFDARSEREFAYSTDVAESDDLIYLLNKDFTISVLNKKAMVIKRMKIDNSNGKGFGIYYTNGYSKKEDRDKEASIINSVLESMGMPKIDLEENIGDHNLLIGIFESIEEAEKFKKELKSKSLSYITKIAPIKE